MFVANAESFGLDKDHAHPLDDNVTNEHVPKRPKDGKSSLKDDARIQFLVVQVGPCDCVANLHDTSANGRWEPIEVVEAEVDQVCN